MSLILLITARNIGVVDIIILLAAKIGYQQTILLARKQTGCCVLMMELIIFLENHKSALYGNLLM